MKSFVIVLFSNIILVSALTCNDILEAPEEHKWSIDELKSVLPKDMVTCLAHLGKEKLAMTEADFIWQTVVKFYDGVVNIPERDLMHLRWITTAITANDLYNMTFTNIDVIENFGLDYHLNSRQLEALADRIREDWGGKAPEDYSYYDLVALRQILCAFNRSEIERIHPEAYKEAAALIGKLNNCRIEVLQGFATLAVQENAFGHPDTWDDALVEALGVVSHYIPGRKFHEHKHQHVS